MNIENIKSDTNKKVSLFLNSDSSRTRYTDLTSSQFHVHFDSKIRLENENAYIELNDFSFINSFNNITNGTASTIYYTDDVLNLVKYNIDIPTGDYNVDSLNDVIQVLLYQNDATHIGNFSIQGSVGNKRLLWTVANGWLVNLPVDSPYALLGQALNDTVPGSGALATATYYEYSGAEPNFQPNKQVKVLLDNIGVDTYYNNNDGPGNILAEVTIANDHPKGSWKCYDNFNHKISCEANNVRNLDSIWIRLVNQDNSEIAITDDIHMTISFGAFEKHI